MCDGVSDRMAAVHAGRAAWTAAEASHLTSCPDCQAEWRLFERAGSIGAAVPPLDADRIAATVRRRIDSTKVVPIRRPTRWVLGLAAAAAVILAVRLTWKPRETAPTAVPVPVVATLSELDELSEQELETVLTDLSGGSLESELGGLDDLNTSELEQILQSWES